MTIRTIGVVAVLLAAGLVQSATRLEFQGVRANYTGEGQLLLGELVGDYMYTLLITGNTSTMAKTGGLTITPREKNTKNRVFINTIYSTVPLTTIKITMPPGREIACYVRNIYVMGSLGKLDITGGDLGSSDMYEGQVVVQGTLGDVRVRGKNFKIAGSNEWWGGNIWADIYGDGPTKRIETYGGHMYYHPLAQMLGNVDINGKLDKLYLRAYEDKKAGTVVGAGLRGSIVVNNDVLKQLDIRGGAMIGSSFDCLQLQKIKLTGQKPGSPQPAFRQGISQTYVTAADVGGDGSDSDLKNMTIKDGMLHNSLFGIKGHINAVKINVSAGATEPAVSNVIMRAGFAGDLAKDNNAPEINPSSVITNVYGGNVVVVPFLVKTANTGDTLAVRLHFRDRAITGFLSNQLGQTFNSSNTWITTAYPVTGMFVWSTTPNNNGWCSNIIVRVHNLRTPYRYYDMYISANVSTTTVPVTLLLTPPNNPRTFNKETEPFLDWQMAVADPWQHGDIKYGLTGASMLQLGLQVTNLDSQTGYVWTDKPLATIPVGMYSNLQFSADNGVYRDQIDMTLIVVTTGMMYAHVAGERLPRRLPVRGVEIPCDAPAHEVVPPVPLQWEGAFNRDIKNVTIVGDVHDSMFVAGTSDIPANNWPGADYLGRLNSVKITGAAESNTFVSVKRTSFGKLFNYLSNFVWIDGTRQLAP